MVASRRKPNVNRVPLIVAGTVLGLAVLAVILVIILRDDGNDSGGGGDNPTQPPTSTPCPELLPASPTCIAFQRGLNVGCEAPVTLDTIRPLTEDMLVQARALFNNRIAYSSETNFQAPAEVGGEGRISFEFPISTEYDTAAWKASQIAEYILQGITANDPALEDTLITVSSFTDPNQAPDPKQTTYVTFYQVPARGPNGPGRTVTMPDNNRNTGSAYVRKLDPEDKCYKCGP